MEDPARYQIGGTHYVEMRLQPWDVIDSWSLPEQVGFYRGNALKYLMRLERKGDSLEDAKKAQHYCEKLVAALEAGL